MIFTVHRMGVLDGVHLAVPESDRKLEAIPETVSIWALLFPPLWLIWHRLWWPLLFYGLAAILFFILLAGDLWPLALFLSSLPALYLYLEGHQLRRNKLEHRGFELIDVVEAPNDRVALARYLSRHIPTPMEATTPPAPVAGTA